MNRLINDDTEIKMGRGKAHYFLLPALVMVIALTGCYLFYKSFLQNPCSIPIHYAIGNVDSRFKISSREVEAVAQDASDRWNKNSGETLLVYDPKSTMKINLVYDDRQARVDQINQESGALDSSGNAIDSFRAKLESETKQYEQNLADYNATVKKWNDRGGAPAPVYSQLQATKRSLESQRIQINNSASLLNQQINDQNSNISQFNNQIDASKNKIITEGVYYTQEKKIDIFTFGNKEELRLVLMHELGHSLSLGHDNKSTSVMYPVLGQQDLASPLPTSEDLNMLNKSCHTISGGFENLWQNIVNRAPQTSL